MMLNKKIKETILITGGAGFIGSNLTNYFINSGHQVICIDNLSGGYEKNLKINKKLIFIKGSCSDNKILKLAFKYNPTIILHLAARKGFNYTSVLNPIEDLKNNSISTLKLLEFSVKKNVKKFIFTSSSCVYGNVNKTCNENTKITLDTPYAISKFTSEEYCRFYQKFHNLNIIIFRLFNTYGPGEKIKKYSNVICKFYDQSIKNETIKITGINSTRSFLYIDDLIDVFKISVYKDILNNKCFNVGNEEDIYIQDLAKLIKTITKSNSLIKQSNLRSWDTVINRSTSIKKISNLSGWSPSINIEYGLKKYYNWFKSNCV